MKASGIIAVVVGGIIFGVYHEAIAFHQEPLSCRSNRRWRSQERFCPALRQLPGEEACLDPWTNAVIDYSGANEYVEAHYGKHPMLLQFSSWVMSSVPYFCREEVGGDKIKEPIYNARELQTLAESELVMTNRTAQTLSNSPKIASSCHKSLLQKYGMTLVNSPTKVVDWKNRKQIEDAYIQELESLLPTLFSSKIGLCCFWNPMLRGENHVLLPPRQQSENDIDAQDECDNIDHDCVHSISTANVASMVHIDTDVGAYDSLEDFLAIVEANEVKRQNDRQDAKSFDSKVYRHEILENRKRFAVVNFWRSTNRVAPVVSSPLAILSTRYADRNNSAGAKINSTKDEWGNNLFEFSAFPNSRPDLERSKWYSFPNMTGDEVLVFYQYDRLATQPSDLWHCAISVEEDHVEKHSNIFVKGRNVPRESFDIRALIVFDEIVQSDEDRFHPERVRPVLSFEESGCFCDEQAIKRI
jgi:hypothetical protein